MLLNAKNMHTIFTTKKSKGIKLSKITKKVLELEGEN